MLHGWYGGYGAAFGFPWVTVVFGLLFLVGVVLLIIYLTKGIRRGVGPNAEVMDKLVERYVKGEITKEQFLEIKKMIEK